MIYQKALIKQEWKEENLSPFNELIITWNARRPQAGNFLFYVSVKIDTWSPWLLYACWGNEGQSSFLSTAKDAPVKVYQDALEVMGGNKATAFQIKIIPEGSAHLDDIYGLHVYTNSDSAKSLQKNDFTFDSVYLDVAGLSQMTLNHIRHAGLCSPTSVTAVIRYLLKDPMIDPLCFAQKAWDSGFDIYGDWVLNVAQAATYLGPKWDCWVQRLSGFHEIYDRLKEKTPVVVSVRGPLPGSAQPYAKGHLLVVTGYDSANQKVICMDPAFAKDSETQVSYNLSDFMQAWDRRGKIAYIFQRKDQ